MKILHINRHAKSSWKDQSLRDFDRPLNKRGKINAAFMSEKFAEHNAVDLIISSPADRAKTTAIYFATALGIDLDDIQYEELIYGASAAELHQLICKIPNEHSNVMIFGHNPTFTDLAWYYDHNFNAHLVTCARAKVVFDFDDWNLLGKDSGSVEEHHYPRMHPEMEHL